MFNAINIWLAFHKPIGGGSHHKRLESEECWKCIGKIAFKAVLEDCLVSHAILAVNLNDASVGGFSG
jgi:hypothetical protein